MDLFRAVCITRSLLFFTVFLGSTSLNAETYDISSFQLAGVTLGDSESAVVENIAKYYSVSTDQIQLTEEREVPSYENAIEPSIFRKYEYDENSIVVRLYPDFLNGNDSEMVVGYASFVPKLDPSADVRQAIVDVMKNRIVAEKGAPTKQVGTALPIYFWCTELSGKKQKLWPCDLKKPLLQMDFNISKLTDDRFKKAWDSAAWAKAKEK